MVKQKQQAPKPVNRAPSPRRHFTFAPGGVCTTLDGRTALCVHVASDGWAIFAASNEDRFMVNPDGRAYDRRDTLQGYKPSSDAHMRVWYPGRVRA